MNRPLILLFVLLVTVPLLVGGAGLASFLLLRAGHGMLVWGLVPFLVLLLLVGALADAIGKASRVTRDARPKGER